MVSHWKEGIVGLGVDKRDKTAFNTQNKTIKNLTFILEKRNG